MDSVDTDGQIIHSPAKGQRRLGLGVAIGLAVVVMVALALAFEPRLAELDVPSFVERFNVFRGASALGLGLPGAFVVSVRPHNRIGWLLAALGLAQGASMLGGNYGLVGIWDPNASLPGADWVMWVSEWVWVPTFWLVPTLLLLIFPTGRLPSPGWRPVAVAAVLNSLFCSVAWALVPRAVQDIEGLVPPGYEEPVPSFAFAGVALQVSLVLGAATVVASLAALIQRYRRATGAERQQLEWVLFAVVALVTVVAAGRASPPPLGPLLVGIAWVPLPVAMAVGVVRHRLWDIDFVFSRSLIFGLLTLAVLAVYGVSLLALGTLLGASTQAPLLAIILVALGIQPAHGWVRRRVNRFVYGERDDPASGLRDLGARLSDSGAATDVLLNVVDVIGRRLRVAYVAVDDTGLTPAVWGEPSEALRLERLSLIHGGTDVGTLVIGTAAGDHLRASDRRGLANLAPHVAVVVHARRLAGELERSYKRLLATRDEERQRLRRELHDGLGPTLVGSL